MKTAIVACTGGGRILGRTIAEQLPDSSLLDVQGSVTATLREAWQSCDALVCIMASGIVVRTLAPLLKDKRNDPAVLVLDEKGQNVISLLSGHLGGGNALAHQVAAITGGRAVITTASDTLGLVALDLWAKAQKLRCSRPTHTEQSGGHAGQSRLTGRLQRHRGRRTASRPLCGTHRARGRSAHHAPSCYNGKSRPPSGQPCSRGWM
jgi:cobalt-precorrin 5A hydrolase